MSRADQALRRKRRKERRLKQHHGQSFPQQEHFDDVPPMNVRLDGYTITFDQLNREEDSYPGLDEMLGDNPEALYRQVGEEPAAAIPQLKAMLAMFPDSRLLMNWLAKAYNQTGQTDKADEIIRRNYQLHPNYLFARINYVQTLLRDGKDDDAADVMDHKWDLKASRPDLDVFHITEFVSLSHIAVIYFIRTGKLENARSAFNALERIVPDHEITHLLRPLIETSGLILMLERMKDLRLTRAALR